MKTLIFLKKRKLFLFSLCIAFLAFSNWSQPAGFQQSYCQDVATQPSDQSKMYNYVNRWSEKRDLGFIENKGQIANDKGELVPEVLFKASTHGADVYITTQGITYVFIKEKLSGEKDEKRDSFSLCRLDMDFIGANIRKDHILKEYSLTNHLNYFRSHCPDGIMNVKIFGKVTVKDIYPGIDWVLYLEKDKGMKYDFVVHPYADPDDISIAYKGAGQITQIDGSNLRITTPFGEVNEGNLISYISDGNEIDSKYLVEGNNVRFILGDYDNASTLIIDPPLIWATYYGGSDEDYGNGIATGPSGSVYITGYTYNSAIPFPTLNPGGSAYFTAASATFDVFILKFSPSGILLWGTHYASTWRESAFAITTDDGGNVYVTGSVQKGGGNFPTYDPGGGAYFQGTFLPGHLGAHLFILKFDSSGVRKWATQYGGTNWAVGYGITTNGPNLYVTGYTNSSDFPLLDPGGGAYYDGTLSGYDAFILRFDTSGVRIWATLYGGSGNDYGAGKAVGNYFCVSNGGNGIITDPAGNVYVTGSTGSADFPTLSPYQAATGGGVDAFLLKFSSTGVRQWATYHGGSGDDIGYGIVTDDAGDIFVSGSSAYDAATPFPTMNPGGGAYFQTVNGNGGGTGIDAFAIKYNPSGTMSWGTLYGGDGTDIAYNMSIDDCQNIYIAGSSTSTASFSTLNPGGGTYYQAASGGMSDAFMLQFDSSGVSNWATYYGGNKTDIGRCITIAPAGHLWITGETNSLSGMSTIDPGGGTYYQAALSGGSNWADMFILKFDNDLSVITASPDTMICLGDTASLTASGGSSYTWTALPGGDPLNVPGNFSCDTCITPLAYPDSTTTYVVEGVDSCGTSYDTVIVYVIDPTFTTSITGTSPICAGDNIILTTVSPPMATYSWNTGATSPSIAISPLSTTIYSVTVSVAGCGVSDVDSITINVNPLPNINITGDSNICIGDTSTLTASGGLTYVWDTGPTTPTISVNPVITTSYSVAGTGAFCTAYDTFYVTVNALPTPSITGDTLICSGDNANLTASGGSSYSWDTGDTTAAITVTPAITSTFKVTVSNGICSADDSILVTVNASPVANITGDTSICIGDNANLTASGGGTYLWSTGATTPSINVTPLSSTPYSVTVSNALCSDSQTVMVKVNSIPTATITGDTNICSGDTAILTASGGSNYLWNTGASTASIDVQPATTTSYSVTVSNGSCSDGDTISVTVTTSPTATITGDSIICEGENATIVGSGGTTYLWNTGETSAAITVNPSTTTIYTITVSDGTCSKNSSFTVTVNASPSVLISGEPQFCEGQSTVLTANSTLPVSYSWNTGDNSQSITVSSVGTYTVNVSMNGCTDADAMVVTLDDCDALVFLPNAFTPDGNGENDILYVRGEGILDIELHIFNRWGEEVFVSYDISHGWDGTFKGKPQNMEVYVFFLKANMITGKTVTKKGDITLIR